MQTKIRKRLFAPIAAAVALTMLFPSDRASATTYTVDLNYDLLNGRISSGGGNTEFESEDIAVNLPPLFAGDVIHTTIRFAQGLALRVNDPGPGTQFFRVVFLPDNSASGIVSVSAQLSLVLAHGDILTPDVVSGRTDCATCVAAGSANLNFTDSTFSFRGLDVVATILNIPQPFGFDRMHFQAWTLGAGDIEITHGASLQPVSVPGPIAGAGLPGLIAACGGLLVLARRRRKLAA
jgi:hypothetical protein